MITKMRWKEGFNLFWWVLIQPDQSLEKRTGWRSSRLSQTLTPSFSESLGASCNGDSCATSYTLVSKMSIRYWIPLSPPLPPTGLFGIKYPGSHCSDLGDTTGIGSTVGNALLLLAILTLSLQVIMVLDGKLGPEKSEKVIRVAILIEVCANNGCVFPQLYTLE